MHSRRALLYMPGDDLHKITKATTLGVDCICMDMEDGVALNRKKEARETIINALNKLDFGNSEKLTRINPVGSGLEIEDLDSVLPARPSGIVIPKVESAQQVRWVSNRLTKAETIGGLETGSIALIAIIESAKGIVNLKGIAGADPRLQALIFGAEDLAGDLGATRSPESWEVFYARSAVVTHAAAFNLQAIDMVYINFKDLEGLRKEALQGAQFGFCGKQVIHPNQVKPVQEAFTPNDQQIEMAMRIIEAYDAQQQLGYGAFALDNQMIDAPIVKSARQIINRARAAGRIH